MDNYSNPDKLNRGVNPFRVVLKALILFVGFNLLLNSFPNLSYFVFRQFLPKLHKFPLEVVYYDLQAGHGFGVQNVFDVGVLFNTHIISYENKPEDQYRVIFIGDSTVRDGTIYPVVNQQGCDGKILHAYDLGYSGASATKDLTILHEAMKYSPDLVVWSVTSDALLNEPKVFAMASPDDLVRLSNTYDLSVSLDNSSASERPFFYGSGEILLQTRLIINYSLLFPAYRNTQLVVKTALNDLRAKNVLNPNQESLPASGDYLFSALMAARKIAGSIPLILINEPRPSAIVSQQSYLQYREEMLNLNRNQRWTFLDLWNLVPDTGFLDTIHRNDIGNALFNKTVMQAILNVACANK